MSCEKENYVNRNLGHIATSHQDKPKTKVIRKSSNEKEIHPSIPMNLCNEIVDSLLEQRNVFPLLVQIKHLLHFDIPLSARPSILKELNKILGALFYQYPSDQSLFNQAQETMTLLNAQIDKKSQTDSQMEELEWDELQKTIYLLSDWEDQIKYNQPATQNAEMVSSKEY